MKIYRVRLSWEGIKEVEAKDKKDAGRIAQELFQTEPKNAQVMHVFQIRGNLPSCVECDQRLKTAEDIVYKGKDTLCLQCFKDIVRGIEV